jgi:hypothetical protein
VSAGRVIEHFREQAAFCTVYGSPFTGELITRLADDIEARGPTAALVADWPANPRADALSLRLAGALHAAVLTRRDDALAALYPRAANPEWRMDAVWPAARAVLERDQAWVARFIQSAPQTNETRRSIALLAGFLAFAETWNGPIDMLEIGASAGLNLNWDRFAYRTATWSWGAESPVVIDTDWHGPPPPAAAITVRHRAACDLNPLDIRDEAQRLQLKSYIWPDQPDRLARFDGAVALAIANNVQVERADAASWLAQRLAVRAGDAATIVYHSIFLQYPPREARAAIVEAIQSAGATATASAPLVWVRLEPEALTDRASDSPRMVVDVHVWPGGERRVLAYTDGHVRGVYAS